MRCYNCRVCESVSEVLQTCLSHVLFTVYSALSSIWWDEMIFQKPSKEQHGISKVGFPVKHPFDEHVLYSQCSLNWVVKFWRQSLMPFPSWPGRLQVQYSDLCVNNPVKSSYSESQPCMTCISQWLRDSVWYLQQNFGCDPWEAHGWARPVVLYDVSTQLLGCPHHFLPMNTGLVRSCNAPPHLVALHHVLSWKKGKER